MFCPECIKQQKPSNPQQAPTLSVRPRLPKRLKCSVCGSILADDRLLPEFTLTAETAKPNIDRPLSVKEVLKAIAGPHPVGNFRVKQILSDQLPEPSVHSSRRNLQPPPALDSDWNHSDSPLIPRGYGRPQSRVSLGMVFGLGSLVAMTILIVAIVAHFDTAGPAQPSVSSTGEIMMPSARIVHDGTYAMKVIGANHGHVVYGWVKMPSPQPNSTSAHAAAQPSPR